jgi:hypothetical protein
MASNLHFVVQTPQPTHRAVSTTVAPQLRQRAVSCLTCSSVKVRAGRGKSSSTSSRRCAPSFAWARVVPFQVELGLVQGLVFRWLRPMSGSARVDKTVDGDCRLLAGGNGVDGKPGPLYASPPTKTSGWPVW